MLRELCRVTFVLMVATLAGCGSGGEHSARGTGGSGGGEAGSDAAAYDGAAGAGGSVASGGYPGSGGSGGTGGTGGVAGKDGGADAAGAAGAAGDSGTDGGDGGATPTCHPLETQCGGQCVDLKADLANCGACNVACAAGQFCVAGQCQTACPFGYKQCSVGGQTQCVTTNTALHCQQCDTRCIGGKICLFGISCMCPGTTTDCGGTCVDTKTDPQNCGSCGNDCGPGLGCNNGLCDCPPGQTNCGGTCVDTKTDLANCGGCGKLCDLPNATETCVNGGCTFGACESGAEDCDNNPNNGCELLDTVEHCGSCQNDCRLPNTNVACNAGQCQNLGCQTGYDECDNNPADGCEALDSLTNCGACGQACAPANATGSCSGGVCQIAACNSLHDNCDGNISTGCETPLDALTDCGGCSQVCDFTNASESCSGGVCQMLSCDPGYIDCGSGTGCVVPPVWYRDADGDGWGVDTDTQTGCTKPSGYADKSGDCDDGNAAVNPGAGFHTTPLPNGSYDYNCDGQETGQYPKFSCTVTPNKNCSSNVGWKGSVPACGGSGTICHSCAWYSINGAQSCECGLDPTTEVQGCR